MRGASEGVALGPWLRGSLGRALRLCFLLTLFLWQPSARAQTTRASRPPRAALLLLPRTPAEPFLETLRRPDTRWNRLREQSGLALLNCAVPGADTAAGSRMAIQIGRRLPLPRKGETVRTPAPATLVGELLRTGRYEQFLERDLGMLSPAQALEEAQKLADRLDRAQDLLILAVPDPDPVPNGQWVGLSPLLVWGKGWSSGYATSATTRTPGVVANTDLAPTLLAHLGVAVPATMDGHPLRPAKGSLPELLRFAQSSRANREGMVAGLLGWGVLSFFLVVFAGMIAFRSEPDERTPFARAGLALAGSVPTALLLTALFGPPTAPGMLLTLVACALVVAGAAVVLGRKLGSPFLAALGLLYVLVVVDLLTGGKMLARNLMSDFANIGARFYGMGNEYEGLLLGAAVLLPFWLSSRSKKGRFSWGLALPVWLVAVFFVGAPPYGADFGGMVSFGLTFLVGTALAARAGGTRIKAGWLLAALAGLGLFTLALIALDYSRGPGERTHVGELAARILTQGPAPLLEMVVRKVGENLSMALTGYFIGAMLAVLPLLWLGYHRVGPRLRAALQERPPLAAGMVTTLVGALCLLLLNDTGVIAGALAGGCALVFSLDLLLLSDAKKLAANERE